jgi:hypothetical protein
LWLDTFYFEADHRFSTSHDYKVAKIVSDFTFCSTKLVINDIELVILSNIPRPII